MQSVYDLVSSKPICYQIFHINYQNVNLDNSGKGRKPMAYSKKAYIEVEDVRVNLMEYNNKKNIRKRGNQKEKI